MLPLLLPCKHGLTRLLAALRFQAASQEPMPGYAGPAPPPPYSSAAVSAQMYEMTVRISAIERAQADAAAPMIHTATRLLETERHGVELREFGKQLRHALRQAYEP